jgi:hypothetical protein
MTVPHSTHRTMSALCCLTETKSEIMRLCVQAKSGLLGRDFKARFDPVSFTVHLWDARRYYGGFARSWWCCIRYPTQLHMRMWAAHLINRNPEEELTHKFMDTSPTASIVQFKLTH